MNLGWKLAAAVHGSGVEWLLDSYEAERHPVGAGVLALTDALNQLVLGRSAIRRLLRRLIISSILRFPLSRRLAAERLSGISIAYPRSSRGDDRLVGRRMPDIECDGTRLYEVLRSGRFVLVTAAGTDGIAVDWPGVDHVVHTDRDTARGDAGSSRRLHRMGHAPATGGCAIVGGPVSLVWPAGQGPVRYRVSYFDCDTVYFTDAVSSH